MVLAKESPPGPERKAAFWCVLWRKVRCYPRWTIFRPAHPWWAYVRASKTAGFASRPLTGGWFGVLRLCRWACLTGFGAFSQF